MLKIDAMIGGILGIGLGDAAAWQFGGLSPKEAHAPVQNHFEVNKRSTWLHGALTAWTVIQIDSMLYRPRGLSYSDDLALRNHLLVAPKNGTALRGNAPAAKNILRQTWKNLNQGDDTKLVGETEPRADLIAAMLPWAFATENAPEQVIEAVMESGMLVSRHPRTLGTMAFYVGAARHFLCAEKIELEEAFATGKHFFDLGLNYLRTHRGGALSDSIDNAVAIMEVETAIAQNQEWAYLLPTTNLDIRSCPEKVLGLSMAFSQLAPNNVHAALKNIVEHGGACDVIAPLALSLFGLRHGKSHLPLALTRQLRSALWLERRVRALFWERPPRAEPWVYLELILSDWLEKGSTNNELEIPSEIDEQIDEKEVTREQLSLL